MEGNVGGQFMVSFVLYELAKEITKAYLTSIPEAMLARLGAAEGPRTSADSGPKDSPRTRNERLVELYIIHVLAKLHHWNHALHFVQCNSILSGQSKKGSGQTGAEIATAKEGDYC
ncbi:hypothetical protein BGX33_005216 [Mortierella sp. NVP41]|nr:hypothetical protein BGX33_005216 [Mortierella sp. NVP41]